MPNLRTKIIALLLFLLSFELSYSQLTLEDIFLSKKYESKSFDDIAFFKKAPKYITLEKNKQKIVIFNTKAGRIDSVLLNNCWADKDLSMPRFEGVAMSNTDKYFLLKVNEDRMYRRAGLADYYITDSKNSIKKIGNSLISFPSFSSDDKKIAYVKENNLFWSDIENRTEQQITTDGKWNNIINGKSDWVYEEEFSLTNAFTWSADNSKIAYLKFDETAVKEYTFPYYYGQVYPNSFSYKYPKAGEQNSKVTAHFFDCKKKKNYKINLNNYNYEYIPRVFSANDAAYFIMLNRHQDTLKIVSYNFKNKQIKLIFTDASDKYVEVPDAFFVLKNNSFIVSSQRDGFNHLYYFDENGKQLRQLTKGDFVITAFYGIDEKDKMVYFQSNEGNATETAIYRLNYETSEKTKISNKSGKNTAVFSDSFSFFLHTFSDAFTTPKISVQQTNLNSSVSIEDNKALQSTLANMPQKEFIKIPVNDYNLNAWLIKPENIDAKKKYPLLMFVYGGPNHQEVLNEWPSSRNLFFNYLAEQGYAVACVDNRGTDGRGVSFKQSTFLNLGKLETEDQITAANYLGNLSYIDKTRIGIFGWSYGAYLSLLTILQKDTPFKAAIAVAPVTNWKFYDNIYTERYMHTPDENPKGYEQFNPISLAKNLNGNLLLIHSTADDNVHFQNSVEMSNALNEANKTYQFYMYPDNAHSINRLNSRYDLFSKMMYFIKGKL